MMEETAESTYNVPDQIAYHPPAAPGAGEGDGFLDSVANVLADLTLANTSEEDLISEVHERFDDALQSVVNRAVATGLVRMLGSAPASSWARKPRVRGLEARARVAQIADEEHNRGGRISLVQRCLQNSDRLIAN
jgi:hypothetical protein